jgi:hypothetical protein
MPDWFAIKTDLIMQMILGAIGGGVRVVIAYDKEEKQSKAKIFATFISGTILAGTSSYAVTEYVGLSPEFSGAVSFLIGLLGIGFIYQLLEGKICLPIKVGKK